jgi:hypothetical protein
VSPLTSAYVFVRREVPLVRKLTHLAFLQLPVW